MSQDLLNLLSAREGHFRLESGHHNDFWLDLDLLFLRPAPVREFARALAVRFARHNIDAICGPLVGGAFIAEMIASELHADFYYTERFIPPQHDGLYAMEYRLPEGLRPSIRDKRVAIVDDVISAGSAVRGTLKEIQSYGAQTVVVGALLVLGNLAAPYFAEREIPMEYIVQRPGNLWLPDQCPLCARNIALEDMVTHTKHSPPNSNV